jgi:prepilin-type N-terminal cleavage/methylation domain-containing protein
MFRTLSTKRGMTLIEVCVALALLSVGVMALISLQPSAWRLSGKSDYLGRASGILLSQLQATEAQIMNPNISPPTSTTTTTSTVYPGGQTTAGQPTAVTGDFPFTVKTTTYPPSVVGLGSNIWRVTVQVTWPGGTAQGIRESLIVAPQQSFAQ